MPSTAQMMGTKMLKEILHSQEHKILYHHKNPTLDTIHMQLNPLTFSPWPLEFHAPAAVREMFKCPLLYNCFAFGWKGSTLLAQHCPICLLNVKITVFHDAMPCSLVNRYQGLGEVCFLHLQHMGLLLPKCWYTITTHSSTLLMTDAWGSSETILHTYQITRYHIPENHHLHHNASCHIPHNHNFNAYHNLNITVKQLNLYI
jgi:hypothetical protein